VPETTWRGTHVGEFLGIAPTGRPIELAVAVMVELRDGLMSAERMYWDRGRLWQQLGIVDPDRGPATA
jgi:carboxymethylenebutenolidase